MGGNAAVINKVTGKREQEAQKVDLKKFTRSFVKKEVLDFLEILNKKYNSRYKTPLWENFNVVKSGYAFNGSSDALMNADITDADYEEFKPTLGDIDITVPEDKKENLWKLLDSLIGNKITQNITYLGSNKPVISSIGHQINSVLELRKDDMKVNLQVDFEFTEYHGENPSEFTKFAHSSSWEDMKAVRFVPGLKGGVSHKLLLRAVFGGASLRKDALIVTPKSTPEKITISKKGGAPLELRMKKFSVDLGVRDAYEVFQDDKGNDIYVDGKLCFKEVKTSNSNYETSVENMFKMIFPTENIKEINSFWSFTGLVSLIAKYHDRRTQQDTFGRFLDLWWQAAPGKNIAQELEKGSKGAEIDFQIKSAAVNLMIKEIPHLRSFDRKIKQMTDLYYSQYGNGKVLESFSAFVEIQEMIKEYEGI